MYRICSRLVCKHHVPALSLSSSQFNRLQSMNTEYAETPWLVQRTVLSIAQSSPGSGVDLTHQKLFWQGDSKSSLRHIAATKRQVRFIFLSWSAPKDGWLPECQNRSCGNSSHAHPPDPYRHTEWERDLSKAVMMSGRKISPSWMLEGNHVIYCVYLYSCIPILMQHKGRTFQRTLKLAELGQRSIACDLF